MHTILLWVLNCGGSAAALPMWERGRQRWRDDEVKKVKQCPEKRCWELEWSGGKETMKFMRCGHGYDASMKRNKGGKRNYE